MGGGACGPVWRQTASASPGRCLVSLGRHPVFVLLLLLLLLVVAVSVAVEVRLQRVLQRGGLYRQNRGAAVVPSHCLRAAPLISKGIVCQRMGVQVDNQQQQGEGSSATAAASGRRRCRAQQHSSLCVGALKDQHAAVETINC